MDQAEKKGSKSMNRLVDRDTVDTGFINVLILKLNNAAWRFTKNRFIDSKIAMKVKIDGSC